MKGRLIIGAGAVVAVVVVGIVVALNGGDGDSETPAPAETGQAATEAEATTAAEVPETTVAVLATEDASAEGESVFDGADAASTEQDCTPTQEPHLTFNGVVTNVGGDPVALQGEYAGQWFTWGNSVQITVPENGGPAIAWVTGLLGLDGGGSFAFQVGHDSRAAHPPPDRRAPENYLAYVGGASDLTGTVGMSLDTLDAGEVAGIEPAVYTQSTFEAVFDLATGTVTGSVTHPDTTVEFAGDTLVRDDKPVWPTPECFVAAMGEVAASDNP